MKIKKKNRNFRKEKEMDCNKMMMIKENEFSGKISEKKLTKSRFLEKKKKWKNKDQKQ